MKCSQSLMNIAVVSAEGHSPWLKQWATLLLEHIGIALPPAYIDENELIPFTVKLHIFDAFFFNVVAVIKASSVCQVHKQTHFHLQSNREKKTPSDVGVYLKCHCEPRSLHCHKPLNFSGGWTACWDEICSLLRLGHHIWGPASFSSVEICL